MVTPYYPWVRLLGTEFGQAVFAAVSTGDSEQYAKNRLDDTWRIFRPHSDAVILVLFAIRQGMRLRIPHDGGTVQIVEGLCRYGLGRRAITVAQETAIATMQSGQLYKIQREDHFDKLGNGRRGWKSAGYDGDAADWYCMVV